MKLLFLDIDGVLNSHDFDHEAMCGPIHRDKMVLLNHVLKETGAYVVLSSAWRYIIHRGECDLRGMEWLLRSHGFIAGALWGITRPDAMMPKVWNGELKDWPVENERGRQISDWLQDHIYPVLAYAVVDDMDLGITEAGHPFAKTDGAVGITEENANELIRLLGKVAKP
jgi:hypothetical protein